MVLDRATPAECNGAMLELTAMALTGYLSGSFACAVFVCRVLGLPDPREGGSGNPGATNVLRIGGRRAAALTLLGDALKGALPVLLARALSDSHEVAAVAGFAAFAGHLYPVFFRFRGGKGMATAFGAVAALAWPVALGMGALWVVVAALSRYSSLASITVALGAPVLAAVLAPHPANLVALTATGGLIVWRHRANMSRLRGGEEPRIGERKGRGAQSASG